MSYYQHQSIPVFQKQTLLYWDPASQDDTLTKTALEWAVENNDRLCTTEILHQEYECHKDSKRSGLNCLRDQVLSITPKRAQVIKYYRDPTPSSRTLEGLLELTLRPSTLFRALPPEHRCKDTVR